MRIKKINMDNLLPKDREFFTIDDLYKFGIFGTKFAARKALNDGIIPFIQISKRRRIIPRIALFHYLKENIGNIK